MSAARDSLPKRHYVENVFERFCAWPKGVLTGNQFYYREDNSPTYLLDVRVPNKINILQRFFVSVLFHFFRPINFFLRKILNASKRRKLIYAEITKQHLSIRLNKKDIQLHTSVRPYDKLISEFFHKEDKLQTRLSLFSKKISRPEDWDKEENIAEFNAMFHEAALSYQVFLIAMQNELTEERKKGKGKWDTSSDIARRVKSQGTDTPYFCFQISYNMLLEMYRAARSRMYIDSANQPHYGVPKHEGFNSSRDDVKVFYDKSNDTIHQCRWRRVFNANMKLFRSAIGGKDVYEALKSADHRVYFPTIVDSSKNGFFSLPPECEARWRHDRKGGSEAYIYTRKS